MRPALGQLAHGIHALHRAGKLHRDIKPSNILVTRQGRVVVLDFGLVQDLGELEHGKRVVGTPSYMAPEQARGESASPASDWYSVGVVLYEALVGRRPHAGRGKQVLQAKQAQDPAPPALADPSVPQDLSDLCVSLLQRDPCRRPSGEEVLAALAPLPRRRAATIPIVREVPFVGRVRELELLQESFEHCRSGRTVALFVSGRSGIGKTALVHQFLRQAGTDAFVLQGRCYERESVPFKAVDSLVDCLCDLLRSLGLERIAGKLPAGTWALARLFPALQGVCGDIVAPEDDEIRDRLELRRLAFRALRQLLRWLARQRPVVLFIDDLQWGDLDSVPLLAELLRPPDPPPMLLLLGFRSEERDSPVVQALLAPADLPTPVQTRELEVQALQEDEAQILAQILARMYRVELPPLQRAGFDYDPMYRVLMHNQLAQAALAVAFQEPADSRPMMRRARRLARELGREGTSWASAVALQVRGSLTAMQGDRGQAATLLEAAASRAEAADMLSLAAIFSRRHGELVGGDRGRELVEHADATLATQNVRNPARFARVFASMPELS